MTRKGQTVLALPLCLVILFGCDKPNPNTAATVTGKVTYKGEPVPAGSIAFTPNGGPSEVVSVSTLNPDGTYSIMDAPLGDFTVTIQTESLNPAKPQQAYPGSGGNRKMDDSTPQAAAKAAPAGKYVKIPKKYSDAGSPLKVKLTVGKQTQNFELTD